MGRLRRGLCREALRCWRSALWRAEASRCEEPERPRVAAPGAGLGREEGVEAAAERFSAGESRQEP